MHYKDTKSKKVIKIHRDSIESNHLREFEKTELQLIQVKDQFFGKFCEFLNDEIRGQLKSDWRPHESNVIAAIEEQWAFFMNKLENGIIKCEKTEDKCNLTLNQKLLDKLRIEFKNDCIVKSPYYLTCIAYDIIVDKWFPDYSRALSYFKKAIELEENQVTRQGGSNTQSACGAAYYGAAWCMLHLKENNYKENALKSFESVLECLSNEMSQLNAMQLLLGHKQVEFDNSDLYKQLTVKASILGSYLNNIQCCIEAVKRSMRLIDLVATKKYEGHSRILEQVKYFSGLQRSEKDRNEFRDKDVTLSSTETYLLIFNHLTSREDCGTIDQALDTLKYSFDNEGSTGLQSAYTNIRILLRGMSLAKIRRTLFNSDKDYNDLTRDTAIATLKENRSYGHAFRIDNSLSTSLAIHSLSENKEPKDSRTFTDLQINEAIHIIQNEPKTDGTLRFDIVIKKANETELIKLYATENDWRRLIKLKVNVENVNRETIERLSSVKAKSVEIESVFSKTNLLKLVEEEKELSCYMLHRSEESLFEKVRIDELVERINQLKTDDSPCRVRFEDVELNQVKNIAKYCLENASFDISFTDVDIHSCDGLDSEQVNFCFDEMNRETCELVIKILRNKNFEFSLGFSNLSDKHVRHLLQHACLDQEDMKVETNKRLSDMYVIGEIPDLELNEFAAKGIENIIEINEKQFVPWRSVAVVTSLGICQIIVGCAMIPFGLSTTVGLGLITEGIADLFTAFRAYRNRQFQWSDYCKQKAVSLAISAVSSGYSKCKSAIQNMGKSIKKVASLTTNVLTGNVKTQVKHLIPKHLAVKFAEASAREALDVGSTFLSNYAFKLIKPKISEFVQSNVKSLFVNSLELMNLLRKLHAIDLTTKSDTLQSKVVQIVEDAINPRHDFIRQQWDSICSPILGAIYSKYGSSDTKMTKFLKILYQSSEIYRFTETVVTELTDKLKQEDKNYMTINLVLHRSIKINKKRALRIVNVMKGLHIFDEHDNFKISLHNTNESSREFRVKIDDFSSTWIKNNDAIFEPGEKSKTFKGDVEKSIDFVCSLYENLVNNSELSSFSKIIKAVSDLITDQLIKIMESRLLQPIKELGIEKLTNSLSKRLQDNYIVNKEHNSEIHNRDQEKYEELKKKTDPTREEKEFVDNYGRFRTIEEQIKYNATDYCQALGVNTTENEDSKVSKPIRVAMSVAKQAEEVLKKLNSKRFAGAREDIHSESDVVHFEQRLNDGAGQVSSTSKNSQFVDTRSDKHGYSFEENNFNQASCSTLLGAEYWIRERNAIAVNKLLFNADTNVKQPIEKDDSSNRHNLMRRCIMNRSSICEFKHSFCTASCIIIAIIAIIISFIITLFY